MPPTTQESRDNAAAQASVQYDKNSPAARQPSAFHRFYEQKYMLFVAIAGNAIFYIQAGKVFFDTQSAVDLSATAFLCSFWAMSSWLIYGILLKNKVIFVANIVGVIGALLVLLSIAIYG